MVNDGLEPCWFLLDVTLPEETRGLLVDQRRDPFCHRLFGASPATATSVQQAATASKYPHTRDRVASPPQHQTLIHT